MFAGRAGVGGADGVGADRRGDDEGLGIMHDERLERRVRTFDDRFAAFHQIQDIHSATRDAAGVVADFVGEPMSPRLDELR